MGKRAPFKKISMASSSNMGMSINQPSIPIFDGENYDYWSIKMKILFILQEIWDLMESGYEEPSTPTNQQREQMKTTKRRMPKPSSSSNKRCSTRFFQESLEPPIQRRHGISYKRNFKRIPRWELSNFKL